jgi:Uma2 family endonuclease
MSSTPVLLKQTVDSESVPPFRKPPSSHRDREEPTPKWALKNLNTLESKAVPLLPTQDDLPCCDGVPMETERHKKQMDLLIDSLEPWLGERGYVSGNMFVYFSLKQLKNADFRGPDVFVTLGLGNQERKSWVVWEEGKSPDVVIELLSESTATEDKTTKKDIYQNQLKVAEYFWFDPFNPDDFHGFKLNRGVYEELPFSNNGFLSQQLGLKLIHWHGLYKKVKATWLRWATLDGNLLLLPVEIEAQRAEVEAQRAKAEAQRAEVEAQRAEQERQQKEQALQRVEQERQQKEQALQRAAQLAEILRKQGIDPDQFS